MKFLRISSIWIFKSSNTVIFSFCFHMVLNQFLFLSIFFKSLISIEIFIIGFEEFLLFLKISTFLKILRIVFIFIKNYGFYLINILYLQITFLFAIYWLIIKYARINWLYPFLKRMIKWAPFWYLVDFAFEGYWCIYF